MPEELKITATLTKKEFSLLHLSLFYRTSTAWIFSFMGVVFLLGEILILTEDIPHEEYAPILLPFFGTVLLFGFPMLRYWNAVRIFKASKTLKNPINYTFSEEGFSYTAEGGKGETSWNNIHKVRELGAFILLYPSKYIINVIPKKSFTERQLQDFRKLVKGVSGLKSSMKK